MKKNITLFLTFLMLSIFSIFAAEPTPEDTPIDLAQAGTAGGPLPPPPAPIDTYTTLFFLASIVLVYIFFYMHKKKSIN